MPGWGKEGENSLGRGTGNPESLVSGLFSGDDGDGRFWDLEELCEVFCAEAVCLSLNWGGREAELDGVSLDSADFVPGGPGLNMDGEGYAVGCLRDLEIAG